ncbi:MAG: DUF1571 domain-containing protein [Phycisphaerae bacterium]|nr:DUF1571 domain-containing protein [Phycisphaerae bacterium]
MKLISQLSTFALLIVLAAIIVGCETPKSPLGDKGVTQVEPADKLNDGDVPKELVKLAKTNHLKLIKKSLHTYDSKPVRDYTCTFYEHERINGQLQPEQLTKVKFLQTPFSVAMKWIKNPPAANAVVYVAGKYKNSKGVAQMVVRPASGLGRFFTGGSVLRLPDCPEAMQHSRQPVTEFGFKNNLNTMLAAYQAGLKQNRVQQEYAGAALVGKQKCVILIGTMKDLPKHPPAKLVTFFNVKTLLPVRFIGYDADGKFLFDYRYTDIKLNTGLKQDDFTPAANDIPNP